MAQFQNIFPVDLNKGPAVVSVNTMYFGDEEANRIGAAVTRDGEDFALGGTCAGTVIRFDGTTVAVSGTVSGNTCYIDLPDTAYGVPGPVQIYVSSTASGHTTTLVAAYGTVQATDTGAIAPGVIPDTVADLIDAIEAAVATIPADYSGLWTSLAPAYSTSAAYAAGDYVTYNGGLYRCISAITSGESWTAAHWTQVNLGADISSLKSTDDALTAEVFGAVGDNYPMTFDAGTYYYVTANHPFERYNTPEFLSTRKALKSVTFTPPGVVELKAKTGYTFRILIGSNNNITGVTDFITEYTLSPGVQYGIILNSSSGTADISQVSPDAMIEIEYISRIDGMAGDIKKLDDLLHDDMSVNMATAPYYTGIISASTGKWSTTSGNYSYCVPIPDKAESVSVTANANIFSVFALLTKLRSESSSSYPEYATGSSRTMIQAGQTRVFDIPSDAKYVCLMKSLASDQNDYTPASVIFKVVSLPDEDFDVNPLGLHEKPRNINALNIVKRCRQMTDIRWIPAVDLPRFMLVQTDGDVSPDTAGAVNYKGTFKAGVEYKGVPYGRVLATTDFLGYEYGTVGHYIPFETFVSSVSNPLSRLCTVDVSSVANHRSVIYATVCSGMTCYALDVPEVATANIASISGLQFIGKINNNGTLLDDAQFEIGDVLNKAGYHTAIITDIIRDADGVIQAVELSDASTAGLADRNYSDGPVGGICRRKGWPREKLFGSAYWGEYSLLRYTGDVSYTPSQYVNIGDEFDGWRIEHFPVMPYEGEGFAYKTGYIPNNAVKLVIALSGYTHVKVFKDGTEISASPIAITEETESIDISAITAGSYTAYLCKIEDGSVTEVSYPCHWSIT